VELANAIQKCYAANIGHRVEFTLVCRLPNTVDRGDLRVFQDARNPAFALKTVLGGGTLTTRKLDREHALKLGIKVSHDFPQTTTPNLVPTR